MALVVQALLGGMAGASSLSAALGADRQAHLMRAHLA
jgi:hypothetical protein